MYKKGQQQTIGWFTLLMPVNVGSNFSEHKWNPLCNQLIWHTFIFIISWWNLRRRKNCTIDVVSSARIRKLFKGVYFLRRLSILCTRIQFKPYNESNVEKNTSHAIYRGKKSKKKEIHCSSCTSRRLKFVPFQLNFCSLLCHPVLFQPVEYVMICSDRWGTKFTRI